MKRLEYIIQYAKAADKYLRKHEDIRRQYEDAIKELLVGDHPEKIDIKRIQGKRSTYYRVRLGDHRIIHAVVNGKIIVINVLIAGSRGDVYKKINGLN